MIKTLLIVLVVLTSANTFAQIDGLSDDPLAGSFDVDGNTTDGISVQQAILKMEKQNSFYNYNALVDRYNDLVSINNQARTLRPNEGKEKRKLTEEFESIVRKITQLETEAAREEVSERYYQSAIKKANLSQKQQLTSAHQKMNEGRRQFEQTLGLAKKLIARVNDKVGTKNKKDLTTKEMLGQACQKETIAADLQGAREFDSQVNRLQNQIDAIIKRVSKQEKRLGPLDLGEQSACAVLTEINSQKYSGMTIEEIGKKIEEVQEVNIK